MLSAIPHGNSESCQKASNGATIAIYAATLITTIVLNALALSGHLSFSTVAYVNAGIGGAFAIYNVVTLIQGLKNKKDKTEAIISAISLVASLALAASGLFFANALPMKAAAGLALGGILFPTAAFFVTAGIEAYIAKSKVRKSGSEPQEPKERAVSEEPVIQQRSRPLTDEEVQEQLNKILPYARPGG